VTSFAQSPSRSPPFRAHSEAASRADSIALMVVERLCETIELENQAVARRGTVDHHACSLRKSQGLLELERLASSLVGSGPSPALRSALAELNKALDHNQRMLRVQLSAAQAVSDIVARAIRESQSDGTYSERSWRGRDE